MAKEVEAGLFGEAGAPNNVVLVSRKGRGDSGMAGGGTMMETLICFAGTLTCSTLLPRPKRGCHQV